MVFLPIKVDLDLHRLPIVTLAVAILCVLVYYLQAQNEDEVLQATQQFCQQPTSRTTNQVMDAIIGDHDAESCELLFWYLRFNGNVEESLRELADQAAPVTGIARQASADYVYEQVNQRYQEFLLFIPDSMTEQLWYHPHSWNPWRMITASFSHSGWSHLIGNLFFFVAFAMAAETIVGHAALVGLILLYAIGTHVVYSLAVIAASDALPTVGLSGVVMAVIALLSYFLPRGNIRCLFWIFIYARFFQVPIWLFAGWYVGWDVYNLINDDGQSGVNFVAHVSGAALGYGSGFFLFRRRKREIEALVKGEAEDFRWLDELQRVKKLENSGQSARQVQALAQLIEAYPQRETELRLMRHHALSKLNADHEQQLNDQRLLDLLLDDQRLGEAVEIYLQSYQQKLNVKPLQGEHYLPLFKLLRARHENAAALALASGFHQRFTAHPDIPQLYYEVACITAVP